MKGAGIRYLRKAGRQRSLARKTIDKRSGKGSKAATNETFREYIARVKPDYQFYTWSDRLIDLFQEVADGTLKRLLIQCPPRHGKTELAKLFAGYYLMRHQDRFVAVASYSMDLASVFSRAARDYYRAGGGRMKPGSRSVAFWETGLGGGLWAAGAGGSSTGKGAHLSICDDPVKDRAEAESPTEMDNLSDWYRSTWRTRVEPNVGAMVIIQTRWSERDLIGLAMELEGNAAPDEREGWHLVDFPAFYEEWDYRPLIPECITVEPDFRTEPGEPLCPERFDATALRRLRASLGPQEFGCLFQQNPQVSDAAIWVPSWWRYRPMANPDGSRIDWRRVILSVDCTFKDSATSDFVAIVAVGERQDGSFDLVEVINERMDILRTMAAIRAMAERFNPSAILIEDKANGPAVISMLKRKLPNIIPIKADSAGKVARARAASPLAEAGSVFLPPSASWLAFMLNQFSTFPAGRNDDIVDALSQALNWLTQRPTPKVGTVSWGRSARKVASPKAGRRPAGGARVRAG